ncbi:hypothetical protein [Paenibacillus turpanensis]|uniref:hypothetical protein n=1 Tax=Paenibacillus turpanensis TaxID=2689078 RepID=UPI0014086E2E|nr:hypothetical protein [Paenibacillus turpanensis]
MSEPLHQVMNEIAGRLYREDGHGGQGPFAGKLLVGGSCGLALQGVTLEAEPRDIDIYVDRESVHAVYERFQDCCYDQPREDETPIYRSVLSHYELQGVKIELVGDFRVRTEQASYRVEVEELLWSYASLSSYQDGKLRLMPLEHELVFNVLRGRPDRYQAIAEVLARRTHNGNTNPLLAEIASRNRFSDLFQGQLDTLLQKLGEGAKG